MRPLLQYLILTLSIFTLSVASTFASAKDYSKRGGEYLILKDIRLAVSKVNYLEKRSVEVEGHNYEASVFHIRCRVKIQTIESYDPSSNVFEDLVAEYELIVGYDGENRIHDKLLHDIHEFWTTHPRDNSVTSEQGLTYKNGSYLMYDRLTVPGLVWFDGKFLRLEFKHFLDKKKSGFGAEQNFWADKIRLYHNGKRIPFYAMVNGLQEEFIRLYDQGKFKRK